MKKTNATRILEAHHIPFALHEYNDDEDHKLELGAAEKTAEKIGVDPSKVFKTIVMRTESKEVCVFCQSAPHKVNLKKARTAAGCKEIASVKPEELLSLTGYVRGGCSPIGMKRQFRTFIDEDALLYDTIYISAGARGQQLELNPRDVIKLTNATVCDLKL